MSALIEAINRLASESMTELNARELLSLSLIEFIAETYDIEELRTLVRILKENRKDLYGRARRDVIEALRSARISTVQQLRPERYIRYEVWSEGEEE